MAVQTQIQLRRGTAATWTSTNPILASGEIGYETDTGKFKIGNGSSTWNGLTYTSSSTAITYTYVATAGQTTFSGADSNGLTLGYTVGSEQVFLNGVMLVRGTDYTATNGTSVVLASGAVASDILSVVAYSIFSVSTAIPNSTLAAKGSIVTASAASTPANLAVGANDQVLVADSTTSTGLAWKSYGAQVVAGKNFLINGGMDFWQRGISSTSLGYVTADRWYINNAGGTTTSAQETSIVPSITRYALKLTQSVSSAQVVTQQPMESQLAIPLAGQNVIVSTYVAASASTNFTIDLAYSTSTDVAASGSWTYISGTSQNVASTTYIRATQTFTVPSTAKSLMVRVSATSLGSGNSFYISGVQLELGSTATPFSRAGGTIQGELAACQRYYYRATANGTGIGDFPYAIGSGQSTTQGYFVVNFPVTMRTQVSTTVDSSGLDVLDGSNSRIAVTGITMQQPGQVAAAVAATVASGITQYRPYFLNTNTNNTGYIGFSAEL